MRDAQASEDTITRKILLAEMRGNGLDAVRHTAFCCESDAAPKEAVAGLVNSESFTPPPPRERLRDEDGSVLPCLWDCLFTAVFVQALFFLSS